MRQHCVGKLKPLRHTKRMRCTYGLGQMRGNRARLRRHKSVRASQYLMPPTRYRVIRRSGKRQGHVMQWCQSTRLLLALYKKRSITVMQKRHVGGSCRHCHRRCALMPRTADRIECLALGPPRPKIEMAAHDLRVEQVDKHMWCNPG